MTRSIRTTGALVAILALFAASCSSDSKAKDSGDKPDSSSGAVTSVEDAKGAVVQIVAEGEFRDPEVGTVSGGGSGSGFIVDPSGIVVTNNHVVTGAGSLKVLVGGDDTEIPAEVLGVSECNDLAVIQLDDEGPWPYLDISQETPEPPMEVFALGFPLGDPEYTATKGVVSKAEADGESSWASVASVIEHDANIQPGNSGGPLVNEDGQVVAVNYASYSNDSTTTQQFYAISSELAEEVVETLKEGDELSIGVNGTAVYDEEAGIAGVWVNALDAGGPAKEAGLKPGDIITNLNGVQLDSGSMEEYCDVLRSASEGEPLSIRVLRFDTSEELEGELFSDQTLTTTYSFASQLGDEVDNSSGEAIPADEYVEVADDTGRIITEIPSTWSDVSTASEDLLGIGTPQPTLQASPSLDAFNGSSGPGVAIVAIDGFSTIGVSQDEVLDGAVEGSGCTESGRDTYDDGLLAGPYAIVDCGDAIGVILTATTTQNADALVLVVGLATNDDELAVLDQILAALVVS